MARKLAIRALEDPTGLSDTPLDYLIRVMRDDSQPVQLRVDCAKAAAPFVHAKLQSIDLRSEEDRTLKIEFVNFTNPAGSVTNTVTNALIGKPIDAASIAVQSVLADDDDEEQDEN